MQSNDNKQGFVTTVWGGPAWLFLHCIAFNYSRERKQGYMDFFKSLSNVLPCGKCRENYKEIITKGKLKLVDKIFKNRETFSKWLFKVHNKVQYDIWKNTNIECNKPMYTNNIKDFNKVKGTYERFRAKCSQKAHGCVIPKNGIKLKSRIHIKPMSKLRNQKHSYILRPE